MADRRLHRRHRGCFVGISATDSFLFAAKWGIVTGDKARKKMQIAGIGVAIVFIVIGMATMGAFFKYDRQPAGSCRLIADRKRHSTES